MLTDLRMPDMDGLELLSRIKDLRPETMVVLMTAYGTVKTAVRAMKLGAEDYLGKPLDVEELEVVLQKTIERKRLLRRGAGAPRSGFIRSTAWRTSSARAPRCWRRSRRSSRSRRRARPCCCSARAARARSCSRRPSTRTAAGRTDPSSRSPARRFRRLCSRASCSDTRRGPSPAPSTRGPGGSRWRRAGRSSSTRSATSRPGVQIKLLRFLEEREFERVGWEPDVQGRRPDRGRDPPRPSEEDAGRLVSRGPRTTASTSSRSASRRSGSDPATSRCSPTTSCGKFAEANRSECAPDLRRGHGAASQAQRGLATFGSSRTPWSAPSCSRASRS